MTPTSDILHLVEIYENARQCYRAMIDEHYDHAEGFETCLRGMYDKQFRQQLEDLVGGKIKLYAIAPPYFLYDTRINPIVICMVAHRPGAVTILHFWISPHYRGKGFGRLYYTIFEQFLRKQHEPHTITLTAYNDVIGFWFRMGFYTHDNPEIMQGCLLTKHFD